MKTLLIIFISLTINCLGQKDTVSGDLYFGFFRYGSFYKQPKNIVKWVENLSESKNKDTLNETEQNILRIYKDLKREKLLYSPYIQMILPNDSVIRIYLNKKDYNNIRSNKFDELQEKKEKLTMKIEVRKIGENLFYCEKMIAMKRIEGQTFPIDRKFKPEDYY